MPVNLHAGRQGKRLGGSQMFTSEKATPRERLNLRLMSGWKRIVLQIVAGLGVTMALAGCEPVQSVYPFFDGKDVVFEPRLVGRWNSQSSRATLNLTRAAENSNDYAVRCTFGDDSPNEDEPQEAEFSLEGHLFKIDDESYLDLFSRSITLKPKGDMLDWKVDSGLFTAPTHTVYRVWLDADQLKLAHLDDDQVRGFVHEKDLKVAVESTDFFLLIAPTRELQSQILAYAEEEGLLDSGGHEFSRQQ